MIYENYHFCHFCYRKFCSNVGPNYPHSVLPVFSFEVNQRDKDSKNPQLCGTKPVELK